MHRSLTSVLVASLVFVASTALAAQPLGAEQTAGVSGPQAPPHAQPGRPGTPPVPAAKPAQVEDDGWAAPLSRHDVASLLGTFDTSVVSTHARDDVTVMIVDHRSGRYICERHTQTRKPTGTASPVTMSGFDCWPFPGVHVDASTFADPPITKR